MTDLLPEARRFAEQALMARLKPGGDYQKNARLKARIAAIRAHDLDGAPEVQSALLALQSREPRTP